MVLMQSEVPSADLNLIIEYSEASRSAGRHQPD